MKKRIKDIVISLLLLVILGGMWYIKNDTVKVSQLANLMNEDWQQVVIKKDENIVYFGNVDNINKYLLDMEVVEVANTEDDFAITIFVK